MMSYYMNEFSDRQQPIQPDFVLVETRKQPYPVDVKYRFTVGVYEREAEKVIEPGALAVITRRAERLLNDPGESALFRLPEAGVRMPSCTTEAGMLFNAGEFYEMPNSLTAIPESGKWSDVILTRRHPTIIDRNLLWMRLEALRSFFTWGEVNEAFGSGEALETLREAGRQRISDHFFGKTARQQNVYLARVAPAELVGSFSGADLGPGQEKIFQEEYEKIIAIANAEELGLLVEALVKA